MVNHGRAQQEANDDSCNGQAKVSQNNTVIIIVSQHKYAIKITGGIYF